MKSALRSVVFICLLSIFLSCFGCDGAAEGYRTFAQKDWFAHFSFEYPENFKKSIFDVNEDEMVVSFVRSDRLEGSYALVTLSVIVIRPEPATYTDAGEYVEYLIADRFNEEKGYRIDEKSTVDIADTEGILVIVSSLDGFIRQEEMLPDDVETAPSLESCFRTIYFDYDELIWQLSLRSYGDQLLDDSAEWQHFLETFEVLE